MLRLISNCVANIWTQHGNITTKKAIKANHPEEHTDQKDKRETLQLRRSLSGKTAGAAPQVLKIKSILVPVDFPKSSEKVLFYAAGFAEQFGAKITLLHVLEPMLYVCEFDCIPADDVNLDKRAKDRLELLASRTVMPGLISKSFVRRGAPFNEISTFARELGIDLIIVSTHGYTGLQHILLGSTAERVVRHAPCPVLLVREQEKEFCSPVSVSIRHA